MGRHDREWRQAYVHGVRDTLESVVLGCPPPLIREIEDWLATDLAEWSGGEPPAPPYLWETGGD
jgi:hypothetical protein